MATPLGSTLSRSALFGAAVGAGVELIHKGELRGKALAVCVVAATAFAALVHFFGLAVAAGIICGAFIGALHGERPGKIDVQAALGGAILGGCVGYVLSFVEIPDGPLVVYPIVPFIPLH